MVKLYYMIILYDSILLYSILFYSIILYYIISFHIISFHIILYYIILYYIILYIIYYSNIYIYDDDELAQTQCCQMIISFVWTGQGNPPHNDLKVFRIRYSSLDLQKFPRWHEMRPAKVVKMMNTMHNFIVLVVQRNNFKGFLYIHIV